MEIKPPAATLPGQTRVRRERSLPVEGDLSRPRQLPVEGDAASFDRLLSEELHQARATAAGTERQTELMAQARAELEQGTRHLVRAGQLLDLVRRGLSEG
jgi:hypothetical protein